MKLLLITAIIAFIFPANGTSSDTIFSDQTGEGYSSSVSIANFSGENAQTLLSRSEEAHIKHDLELAKELLTQVFAANATEEERATAGQRLATLEWRFYGQYEKAREHLARAATLNAKRSETLIEKARMESSLANFDEAYLAAQKAISEAKDNKTLERAKTALARVVVNRVLYGRLYKPAPFDNADSLKVQNQIVEANQLLLPIVQAEPGQFAPSKLQLTLSLLLHDGQSALFAWRSFYHIRENAADDSLLSAADKKLANILTNWGKSSSTYKTDEDLALALAESRLFEDAALIALKLPESRIEASRLKDITRYARFCRRIQDMTNEYYRLTALKQGKPDEFRNQLMTEAESLWNNLSRTGETPKYDPAAFMEEMRQRFGAEINLGTTAGYFDLHMGHRVIDEKRTIRQYKYSADIRFISLDTMVSNGFQSWAWDGRAQHGGWATDTQIVQVRPAYNGSFRTWNLLIDPVEKKKIDEEIAKDSLTDESKARQNPYAFLPGLQKRLLRRGRGQLITQLRDKGLTGNELRLAFLAEYEKASVESSIFSHEGRHAIDSILKLDLTAAEREYRAKLSEIAFASEPCLNIGSIFDANIGDDTPHGIANLKIMKGVVKWMQENSHSISGLDLSKPLLLQFDLLTDAQIRGVFRSMDPFYEG